jgi:hypothetical protein
MHTVWIRIDATLPWIELKGMYQTRDEAKKGGLELADKVASGPSGSQGFESLPRRQLPV